MTNLRKRMLEELQRRNYSSETIRAYLFAVKDFATYFGKRPDLLRQEHLRQYQLHLLNDRKLTVDTIVGRIAALRFLFVQPAFGGPEQVVRYLGRYTPGSLSPTTGSFQSTAPLLLSVGAKTP